eukprot:COSAG01_NODE_18208_length_1092_cov_9.886203_1_plen_140_part_00
MPKWQRGLVVWGRYFAKLSLHEHSMLTSIEHRDEWTETLENTAEDGVALVVAWHSPSCADSQEIMPELNEMADEFRGVVFATVDVDATDVASGAPGYAGMTPSFTVYRQGEVVGSLAGDRNTVTLDSLRELVAQHWKSE